MTPISTPQVADIVGIHLITLERWLSSGKVESPKKVRAGNRSYRLWTQRDIERLKQYKAKYYRKGRGRKKKSKG